jgi:hypothetical protein
MQLQEDTDQVSSPNNKLHLKAQSRHTECGWHSDNDALSLKLLGEIDLVSRRVFNQDV